MKQMGGFLILRSLQLLLVINFQMSHIFVTSQTQFIIKGEEEKAMDDKFILKIFDMITKPLDYCLKHCLENCLCRSFQICHMTECQLCSSDQYAKNTSLQSREGCTYFDFFRQHPEQSNQQCSDSCQSTSTNCCLTSNPCLNGGTCLPSNPTTRQSSRFTCKCPDGFTGIRCQEPIKSCRGYTNGTRVTGNYTIVDSTMKSYQVFCDFDLNTSMTWTLIQSHTRGKKMKTLASDEPLNQDTPNWNEYRLSKSRMESIKNDSTKWRLTCQYQKRPPPPQPEYILGANENLDILTNNKACSRVDYIRVRGYSCSNCTVYLYQTNLYPLHFYSAKAYKCYFQPATGRNCGDYFGDYTCKDTNHACSASETATTQTWFGA